MEAMEVCEEDRRRALLQVLEILDGGLQRVSLEEDAALEVAEAVARGARGVADRRARLEERTAAGDPGAPAEVDVLEIREVVVVEATELEERLAARDHVAAAREEDLGARRWLRTGADRHAKAVLKRVAVERHRAADEVDLLSVEADDAAADGDDVVRRLVDGARDRREPARLRDGVVVEEDHVPRTRRSERGGDAAGEAAVRAERDEAGVGIG